MTYHHKKYLKPHRQLAKKIAKHNKAGDWPSPEVMKWTYWLQTPKYLKYLIASSHPIGNKRRGAAT